MTSAAELPEIPQRELRNNSSRVLRDVRAGQAYTITVDGAPVADLIPHREIRRRLAVPRDEAVAAFVGLGTHQDWSGGPGGAIDDSLYDPYDRAHRRGEFAPGGDE